MDLLGSLSNALSGAPWIAAVAALGWGFASIWMSPCHLAGVPLVVGYLSATPETPVRHGRAAVILAFALGTLLSLLPLGAVTLLLGPCAFAWIAPLLGVAWMQAADGIALPALLLALFAAGHCAGVLLAAGSLDRVQRWLDALGKGRGIALGRAACGALLLLGAGALIAGAR